MKSSTAANQAALTKEPFTGYQVFVIAILAFLQFTIILDFMVMAPLGEILTKQMQINPKEFSWVVSAYAFSAGISGLLAAGFADKYDRKKLLLFFYVGFLVGTLLCGIANNYYFLLGARIVTGIFGGVVGSISAAIITDLFRIQQRGRVMGFVQMAFSLSQIAGIPFSLYLAHELNWHAPFLLIVGISTAVGVVIVKWLKPVNAHLSVKQEQNPFKHLKTTLSNAFYRRAFITTALLSIGGFLMMPFTTQFLVNNILIPEIKLPLIFMTTGLCSLAIMPIVGRYSDRVGKFRMFMFGTLIAAIMIGIYVNLGPSPVWVIMLINALMFLGIMSRMIPSMALMSGIPTMKDRGAFMAINSSTQQIAGGIASIIGGLIIIQLPDGKLLHFDLVGYLGIVIMGICAVLMWSINKAVSKKVHQAEP
ncbi:MAG: MFS transporter [Bacteroidota bacterium]